MDPMGEELADWHPQPERHTDRVGSAAHVSAAMALEGLVEATPPARGVPPLWHWFAFSQWPSRSALGSDGHPRSGGFLPPIPERVRQFGGGRVDVTAPLQYGQWTERVSTLTRADAKVGRSGALFVVTVRTTFAQQGEVRRVEELDFVYRRGHGPTVVADRPVLDAPSPTMDWHSWFTPDAAMLFRFSALTANSHRIHYDQAYARKIEGYPDLVVHGPLLAVVMAAKACAAEPQRTVSRVSFRFHHPVFVDRPVLVEGTRACDGDPAKVVVRAHRDEVAASAEVVFA